MQKFHKLLYGCLKIYEPILTPLASNHLRSSHRQSKVKIGLKALQTKLQTNVKHTFKPPIQTKSAFIKSFWQLLTSSLKQVWWWYYRIKLFIEALILSGLKLCLKVGLINLNAPYRKHCRGERGTLCPGARCVTPLIS